MNDTSRKLANLLTVNGRLATTNMRLTNVLWDLMENVPNQSQGDWWSDELTKAMEQGKLALLETIGEAPNSNTTWRLVEMAKRQFTLHCIVDLPDGEFEAASLISQLEAPWMAMIAKLQETTVPFEYHAETTGALPRPEAVPQQGQTMAYQDGQTGKLFPPTQLDNVGLAAILGRGNGQTSS